MELMIVRHAEAEPARAGLPDARRALTKRGVRRFTRAARAMKRFGLRCDNLYHSPWLRAVQTAELLTPLLKGESFATSLLAREPSGDVLDLLKGKRIALVGHEPWLGELAALLITGDAGCARAFALKKGGVLLLKGKAEFGGMELIAALSPDFLADL